VPKWPARTGINGAHVLQRVPHQGHLAQPRFIARQRQLIIGAAIDVIEHHARQSPFGQKPQIGNVAGPVKLRHPDRFQEKWEPVFRLKAV
jgi:hypothetical protein